jgi:hypothetical protein
MTEPKPTYSISPEKPKDLPPGSTPLPLNLTINGEPLSTKQLYEIITSQNIRNDQTLIKNDELVKAIKEIRNLVNGTYYIIEPSLAGQINSVIKKVLWNI